MLDVLLVVPEVGSEDQLVTDEYDAAPGATARRGGEAELRSRPLAIGDSLDLGGTRFVAVEPVIFDLRSTRWGFDTSQRVPFRGDGFAHSHYHEDGYCGSFVEETPTLAIELMTSLFAEFALCWTRFTDLGPYLERLDDLLDELGVEFVAPTHGLPITDLELTMPRIREGLLLGGTDGI